MNKNSDDRLNDLESRFAFLQRTVDELNLIVAKQHDHIDELTKRVRELSQQIKQSAIEKDPGEKPPHY